MQIAVAEPRERASERASVFSVSIRFRLLGSLTAHSTIKRQASKRESSVTTPPSPRLACRLSVCSLGGKLCTSRSCRRAGRQDENDIASCRKIISVLSAVSTLSNQTIPIPLSCNPMYHVGIKESNAHKSNEEDYALADWNERSGCNDSSMTSRSPSQ